MKEVLDRLKTKQQNLEALRESLFTDLGRSYHKNGNEVWGEKPNETAKVRDKIRKIEKDLEKVNTAIAEVNQLSMTVA